MVLEREVEMADRDGVRNMLCVRYPVTDDGDGVSGIGSIYLDITRQKKVEAELRSARAALMTRAEALNESNDQLRALDRMKTEFIASVSHELRTPLTSIRGYLEMLRDGGTDVSPEMSQRFLAIIDRNSEHLLSLIEDLLILSRMDSGQYSALDREISLPGIIGSAVSMLQPAAQQALLTVDVDIDDDLPPVAGDPGQLERVVINLLSNAVKFSSSGGTVAIRATRGDGGSGVSLTVQDQGIGIAPEEKHQLFTRFFRTSAARERGIPGTGLGLAVVRGIVGAHGGTVSVDSALGRGTTMKVRLPAMSPQPPA
jgi:signal transduction histidine kinase